MRQTLKLLIVPLFFMQSVANANEFVRWTGRDDADASLPHVIATLSTKLGVTLDPATFQVHEDRDLAFTHFTQVIQTHNGTPVDAGSIRIWTDLATGKLIQMEAFVERPETLISASAAANAELTRRLGRASITSHRDLISDARLKALVMSPIRNHEDFKATAKSSRVMWSKGRLVSVNILSAKRGTHEVRVDLLTGRVISSVYHPFPEADQGEIQVEADLFPYYEEFEGTILPRQHTVLRHILPTVRSTTVDPFAPTRDMRYLESMINPDSAGTPEGRRAGFWTEALVRQRVATLASAVPELSNTFEAGLTLAGTYCSVMIHPDAIKAYPNVTFTPRFSNNALFDWKEISNNGTTDFEMTVASSYFGKPIESAAEAAARPATRHPFHDPQTYINEGFDDLQVYGGVNQFFEALHLRGFTDPELSTRPFTAFLFNPDISMRDNAFYTDDTINFTTYSAKGDNAARNNGTIWHELGHGLMERLMGNAFGGYLQLADTGGLSEGMADFTANLVMESALGRENFPGRDKQRIFNHTGFVLTNEVHDDGEAYGGSMHDILEKAISLWGVEGVHKVTDLTLETMRLTRYHPHLTAADFFDHMLFADELGRPGVRLPGELASLINESLASRNFVREGHTAANLSLVYDTKEVAAGQPGSRGNEIKLDLAETETKTLPITFSVTDGDSFQFHYPLRAKLFKSERGALQGAVHWETEEQAPAEFQIPAAGQPVTTDVGVTGKCDYVNRDDGSCSDYVYLLIFDDTISTDQPVAKKRFYVRMKTKQTPLARN